MADATKSALFVDYESIHRSLTGDTGGPGEARLADRADAWLAAIERGQLIQPGRRRHLALKRLYAGPTVQPRQREALAAAGFDVIDVGATDSARNSAELHMAMDTIDALAQPDGCGEFILLTASADLAPLLTRLKANRRHSVIYVDPETPDADRNLADAALEGTDLAIFLASDESAPPEERKAAAATERAEIETFARKVHAATNIPLFSPKTFAELFQHLTDEIAQNGYHFQSTAQNVAQRMTAAGRTINRRQIVFIVKGLALKGHVFSTSDTPQRLAEVFREQARYLITNAGMKLTQREEKLLAAWIMSRARPTQPAAAAAPAPVAAKAAAPSPPPSPVVEAPRPAEKAPPPAATLEPASKAPAKPAETPKPAPKAPPISLRPSPNAREEAKAIIAARIADAARLRPGARTPKATPRPVAPPANPAATQSPAAPLPPANGVDPIESTILAAIAEAVDVLVDDGANGHDDGRKTPKKAKGRRQEKSRTAPEPKETVFDEFDDEPPAPAEEPAGGDGDIGDQIQRIIASYNRNRTNE